MANKEKTGQQQTGTSGHPMKDWRGKFFITGGDLQHIAAASFLKESRVGGSGRGTQSKVAVQVPGLRQLGAKIRNPPEEFSERRASQTLQVFLQDWSATSASNGSGHSTGRPSSLEGTALCSLGPRVPRWLATDCSAPGPLVWLGPGVVLTTGPPNPVLRGRPGDGDPGLTGRLEVVARAIVALVFGGIRVCTSLGSVSSSR